MARAWSANTLGEVVDVDRAAVIGAAVAEVQRSMLVFCLNMWQHVFFFKNLFLICYKTKEGSQDQAQHH